MNMLHKQSGDWLVSVSLQPCRGVNSQGGPRGTTKVGGQLVYPQRFDELERLVGTSGMLALNRLHPPGGSPLLFQTGDL
jgi:hypothetical protein